MTDSYLEVTYRHGRPLAAYYYLPRRKGDRAYRTARGPSGLLVDYARGGRAIGIEITAPSALSLVSMNRLLRSLGHKAVKKAELSPLLAAQEHFRGRVAQLLTYIAELVRPTLPAAA